MENGAEGESRTRTVLLPVDFESTASTNFTTSAQAGRKKTAVNDVKGFLGG